MNHERLRPATSMQPQARFYPVGGEEQTPSRSLSKYKQHQAALSPGWQRDLPVSPESWPPKLQQPGWKGTGVWQTLSRSPAAGLGQGQREPSGTGERAHWDRQGWCRSMQQNPPRPEYGTVLGRGLRRRPAFRRAGGSRGMSSCS